MNAERTRSIWQVLACWMLLCGCGDGGPMAPADMQPAAELPGPGPLYPVPQFVQMGGAAVPVTLGCVDTSALPTHDTIDRLLPELADDVALPLSDLGAPGATAGCDWHLRFVSAPPALQGEAAAVWALATNPAAAHPERYILAPDAHAPDVQIFAPSEAAGLFALRRALSLVSGSGNTRAARALTLVDYAGFPGRGVVEGYYGQPYSRAQRAQIMHLMGRAFMDTYVYAPKADDYCYANWPTPYPQAEGAAIQAAAAYARNHMMTFRWGISPGWGSGAASIKFSSAADLARLSAKLQSVAALGVKSFAVLLDDVSYKLYWPEDQAAFETVGDAHAYFLNQVLGLLRAQDPSARLLAVGTIYTSDSMSWQDYNSILGHSLLPGIDMMWTGPDTYSATIQASDLAGIDRLLGRNVVMWDNEPAELGPVTGRSADLLPMVSGYLFNPVVNQDQYLPVDDYESMLGPEGDFLWNPGQYSPVQSFVTWNQIL